MNYYFVEIKNISNTITTRYIVIQKINLFASINTNLHITISRNMNVYIFIESFSWEYLETTCCFAWDLQNSVFVKVFRLHFLFLGDHPLQ